MEGLNYCSGFCGVLNCCDSLSVQLAAQDREGVRRRGRERQSYAGYTKEVGELKGRKALSKHVYS